MRTKAALDDVILLKTMNHIGISGQSLACVTDELDNLLCSFSIYYQNLRTFHWYIKGKSFFELHQIFEEYYNDANDQIDEIAERILTIGGQPSARLSDYILRSVIEEAEENLSDTQMVDTVRLNVKILIAQIRRVIDKASEAGDEGTIDFIGGVLSKLEKQSWMLGAWQGKVKASQQAEFTI